MIDLVCGFCSAPFSKKKKYVTSAIKHGQTVFYCDLKCAKSKEKEIFQCHTCGADISRSPGLKRSKSGFYYCNRKCATISNNSIYKSKENHPNWTDGECSYREERSLTKCADCPETRYFLMTVHHKDGNRKNNTPENLEDVCVTCHVMRHLAIRDGRLIVRWGVLTSPEAKELLNQTQEEYIEIEQFDSRPAMG